MDLPLRDVLWCVALLGEFVVDESEFAALLAGGDSVQADVELGTVVRVRVPARFVLGCGVNIRIVSSYLGWGSN